MVAAGVVLAMLVVTLVLSADSNRRIRGRWVVWCRVVCAKQCSFDSICCVVWCDVSRCQRLAGFSDRRVGCVTCDQLWRAAYAAAQVPDGAWHGLSRLHSLSINFCMDVLT